VLGESGLGKTRLVQEFCQTLAGDRRILLMHGRQAEGNLPFQPFIELFRNSLSPEEWLSLSPIWAGHLAVLLPELLVMRPDLETFPAPSDPSRSSALLYESIRQVLVLIAQNGPLILFLDDAHWADEATLAAVAYLLERPPFDLQALLILAYRKEEANPNLENLLSIARPASMFRSIPLSRLSPDEIFQLGRSILGALPDSQFIQHLAQGTGGNPLFILETLRALKEPIQQSEVAGLRLPTAESIQTLIRSRLRRLTPEAREVLETAAIIGSEFDPEVISQVNEKNLAEVGASLDELETHTLVEPLSIPPQPIRYGFIHDKFREIILEELKPMRTVHLHRRVAHTLAANPGIQSERQAAVIAQHYEAGGEAANAFKFWLEAGEHARRLYSSQDAMRIFKHAESLIDISGNQIPDEPIRQLYSEWTQVAFTIEDERMRHCPTWKRAAIYLS
jgi:predicted ATPase